MTVADATVAQRPMRLKDRAQHVQVRSRALAAKVRRALAATFPERQILIRECGRMSIYRLSQTTQAAVAAGGLVMSGLAVAVVVAIAPAEPDLHPSEVSAVITVRPDSPVHADRLTVAKGFVDFGAIAEVPAEQSVDTEPAGKMAPPEVAAGAISDPTKEAPASTASVATSDGAANGRSTQGHTMPVMRNGGGDVAEEAADTVAQMDQMIDGKRLREQLAAIDDRIFALTTRGLGAPPAAEDARAARLAATNGLDGMHAHVASIERHVDRLASRIAALRQTENALVREVHPQLAYFIETAERVIERSGLDLDDVFRDDDTLRKTHAGGPFVAAVRGPLAAERAKLQTDLAHWQRLRSLVQRMPLAAPLDRYAISSSFGRRKDPLNDRRARHNGVDMISAIGTNVRATAPGVVVFAGRNGGYGNFIEIDHGRSLRTRYAHLRSIKVKKGDRVEFLQPIGTLGNTGRSTGAHLHYEIVVADRPVDPMNFIKAGQHVFQE